MTPEQLKTAARQQIERGLREIQQDGELPMQFIEYLQNGSVRYVVFDGSATNSKAAKRAFGARIRADVAAGECVATLMLSDTFFATDLTLEANKIRAAFGWNIEEAAAAGLCEKREGVVIQAEMRGYSFSMRQEYQRNGSDVTLIGEPILLDTKENGAQAQQANLSGFFNTPAANAARN